MRSFTAVQPCETLAIQIDNITNKFRFLFYSSLCCTACRRPWANKIKQTTRSPVEMHHCATWQVGTSKRILASRKGMHEALPRKAGSLFAMWSSGDFTARGALAMFWSLCGDSMAVLVRGMWYVIRNVHTMCTQCTHNVRNVSHIGSKSHGGKYSSFTTNGQSDTASVKSYVKWHDAGPKQHDSGANVSMKGLQVVVCTLCMAV